jgi:hypothetical protein
VIIEVLSIIYYISVSLNEYNEHEMDCGISCQFLVLSHALFPKMVSKLL